MGMTESSINAETLISLYGGSVYSFCLRLAGGDGDDLYQETFLRACKLCGEGRINAGGNPKSFLFSIAVGLWKNMARKAVRRPAYSMEDSFEEHQDFSQNVEEDAVKREQARVLRKCVAALPEKQRIPVLLFYGEEYGLRQIAEILGCPEGTVKSRLSKARGILKKEMEKHGYGKY